MNNSSVSYLRKPLALFGAGLSLFAAQAAFAQTAAAPATAAEESVKLDKFVVTGSYIPIAGVATAIPVTVLDSKAIEATGVTSNVMEILRKAAPQFTGNGNLGNTNANIASGATGGGSQVAFRNTQTLVLLNGRRVAYAPILASGGFQYVDVNLFPVGAIERIEILQDGASALYGTDAVSGVVNIILKSNYKGFTADANYSFSDNPGKWASRKFSLVGGTGTDKTNITVGAEWYQQDPMKQYERSYSNPIYGTATFAGIVNIGSQFYVLNPSLNAPPNPGTHLSAADLVANGTYIALASSSNLISGLGAEAQYSFNLAQYPTLVLGSQRKSVTVNFDHKWTDGITVFGDMLWTQTNTFSQLNAQPTSFGAPNTNVNNPFNVTVTARNRFLQNPRQYFYDSDSIRGVIGIKGTFGDGFSWEAAANKNIIGQKYRNEGVVSTATRAVVTANGSINYFARNQAPGAVASSGLFGTALGNANSTLTTYDARLVGKLMDLPGGELGFAAGVEYRTESLDQSADRNSQAATFGWDSATTLDPFSKRRSVQSAFAELRIPVFGGNQKQDFAHLLEVSVAGRKEAYSDTDDPLVPKFSLRWLPVDDQFAIRGTYSKSFAAPTLFNLFGPGGVGFTSSLNLQRFGGGPNITGQANARSGANPGLLASRSKSYTFGFVYSPRAVKGFSVTMDYFDIKQTDLISSIGSATILQSVELLGTASPYASFVRRGPNGDTSQFTAGAPITAPGQIGSGPVDNNYVTDTLTNIAGVNLSGIDLKVEYTWNSDAWGKFDFSLAGDWYNSYTVQSLPDEDPFETVGLTSNTNGTTPEWQTYTSVNWSRGKWGATLGWTFIPHTTDVNGIPAGAGVDSASDDYVESYHSFDLSARYSFGSEWRWLNGLTLRVGAQNVLNEGLPMNKGTDTSSNGDIATYGAVGRLIFVEGKYSF